MYVHKHTCLCKYVNLISKIFYIILPTMYEGRSQPRKSNCWLLYYFNNYLLFQRDFCMTALRTLQQHGFDSQNSVGRPVSQAGLLQTLHFGSRAQEHNSSTVPEPRPCGPLCSVCMWPWPLKTSSSAWGAAVLFDLLPLGKGELAFFCRDFWCEWELRWDAEGLALLTAVLSVLETAKRGKFAATL